MYYVPNPFHNSERNGQKFYPHESNILEVRIKQDKQNIQCVRQ